MSSKHREKIKSLKALDDSKLFKAESPVKYFSTDKSFSLGSGSMGTCVYLGVMEDGSEVAIKAMILQVSEEIAENERNILSLIQTKNSQFVVNYRHFFRDKTFMYLVIDLCEETLKDHVRSQSPDDLRKHARRMIKEILSGLEFLHNQGILHRDLKPSNVLVDIGGHMRLADFGISRILKAEETTVYTNAKGTPGWMAAEIIETIDHEVKCRFKKKSDIQVSGMIAFFILTKGDHPFGSIHDRMGNIMKGNPVNLQVLNDKDAREFVLKLICHEIEKRPYAFEALRHSYLNEDKDYSTTLISQDIDPPMAKKRRSDGDHDGDDDGDGDRDDDDGDGDGDRDDDDGDDDGDGGSDGDGEGEGEGDDGDDGDDDDEHHDDEDDDNDHDIFQDEAYDYSNEDDHSPDIIDKYDYDEYDDGDDDDDDYSSENDENHHSYDDEHHDMDNYEDDSHSENDFSGEEESEIHDDVYDIDQGEYNHSDPDENELPEEMSLSSEEEDTFYGEELY